MIYQIHEIEFQQIVKIEHVLNNEISVTTHFNFRFHFMKVIKSPYHEIKKTEIVYDKKD